MANNKNMEDEVKQADAVVPEAPVQEVKAPVKEEKKVVIEVPEDRSMFNCIACAGEGLKDMFHRCENCNGTGKVA